MEVTNSQNKIHNNETMHPVIGKDQWRVMNYLMNTDNNGSQNDNVHIVDNDDKSLDVIDNKDIPSISDHLGTELSGSSNEKSSLGLSPKRSKCILNNDICIVESIDNNSDNNNSSMLNSSMKWNNNANSPISTSENNQITTPSPVSHSYNKYNSIHASSTISTTPVRNIQKEGLDIDLDLDVELEVEIDENDINNNNDEDIELNYNGNENSNLNRETDSLFNNKQGIFFIKKNNTGINQTTSSINNNECFDNNNGCNNKNACNGSQLNDQYKSGYKGVSWNKRMQSWLAFWTEGQRRRSKTFNSKIYGFDVARSEAIAFLKAKQNELQSNGQLQSKKSLHYLRQSVDNISSLKTMNGIYLPTNKYNNINHQNNELLCDIVSIKDNDENIKNNNIDNISCNIKTGIHHPLINGQDFMNKIENKNILQQKSLFSTYGYNDSNCNIVEKLGLSRINYPNIIYDENIIQNSKVSTAATIGQYYTLQDLKGVPSVPNFQFYNASVNNGSSNNNTNVSSNIIKNDGNCVNNKIINNISRNVIGNNKTEKYDDNINSTHGLFKTNKNVNSGNNVNSSNVSNGDAIILNSNNNILNLNGNSGIMGNMLIMNNNNNHAMNIGGANCNKNESKNSIMNSSQSSSSSIDGNSNVNRSNSNATSLLQIALNTINDNNIKINEFINNNHEKVLNDNNIKNDANMLYNFNNNNVKGKQLNNIKSNDNNKINNSNVINYASNDINKDIKSVIDVVSNIKSDDHSMVNNNECWSNIFQYNSLVNSAVNYNLINNTNYNGCNSNVLQSDVNGINTNFLNAINILENNVLNKNKVNDNDNKNIK